MKKEKKILSYYTARKIDFAIFLVLLVGLLFFLISDLRSKSGIPSFGKAGTVIPAVIALSAVFLSAVELIFRKDRDDELAKHDMAVAREKLSRLIPWLMTATGGICLLIPGSASFGMNKYDIGLLILIISDLYLTLEQGLFLIIHGRETKGSGEPDE